MSRAGQPVSEHDPAPLRCCLLSGGSSRRMGRDKALLPHPEGGTWLERTLMLLAQLEVPITLLSRHPAHLEVAQGLAELLAEPPPWEGPLLALHRLMGHHPHQRLLLCPVDMPWLTLEALRALVAAAENDGPAVLAADAATIHLAHDGQRLQPLLGVYPSSDAVRSHLAAAIQRGERGLQRWLASQCWRPVPLDCQALRNVNRPQDLASAP